MSNWSKYKFFFSGGNIEALIFTAKSHKFSEMMLIYGVYLFSWARRRVCLCERRRVHSLRRSTPHRAPSLSAPGTCSDRHRKKKTIHRLYPHQPKSSAKAISLKHVLVWKNLKSWLQRAKAITLKMDATILMFNFSAQLKATPLW